MSSPTTYLYDPGYAQGPTTYNPDDSVEPVTEATGLDDIKMKASIWTVPELRILGGFLWFVVILALIGNMSCFYAVWKNWKKILEHPFFQSNVFCVLLSVADVLLILLVGIPAAVFLSNGTRALGDGFYNAAVVEPILDYLVWLQLLLVVAISVDRAGHICRPLTYTFSIKASKATAACLLCITIPFFALNLPYIIMADKTVRLHQATANMASLTAEQTSEFVRRSTFKCKGYAATVSGLAEGNIFMTCTLMVPSKDVWSGGQALMWWETVAHPFVLLVAILALIVSNSLIVHKLFESAAFQKNNQQRQDEVARSVRINSIVSVVQAVLLLVCTLPMRVYQMEDRFELWEECDTTKAKSSCTFDKQRYSHHYILIAKVIIFLGPMLNPWLYPIRMASIRSFLITKRKSVVTSARRLTISSRGTDQYRSKHKIKNEYLTLETAERGDDGKPELGSSKSKQYSRL